MGVAEAKQILENSPAGWADRLTQHLGTMVKVVRVTDSGTVKVKAEGGSTSFWPKSMLERKTEAGHVLQLKTLLHHWAGHEGQTVRRFIWKSLLSSR